MTTLGVRCFFSVCSALPCVAAVAVRADFAVRTDPPLPAYERDPALIDAIDVTLRRYAPPDGDGRVRIGFEMQDTGADTRAEFHLTEK